MEKKTLEVFRENIKPGYQNNQKTEYASVSLLASTICCQNAVFQSLDRFEGQDPKPIAESQGSGEWRMDAE